MDTYDKKIEINCGKCEKPFLYSARQRKYRLKENPDAKAYCSAECRLSVARTGQDVKCENCDKNYYRLNCEPERKFCSQRCAATINNKKRKENGYTTKNKTKEIICIICGLQKSVPLNKVSICSSCSRKQYEKRRVRKTIEKNCNSCDSLFETKEGLYCEKCLKERQRKNGCKSANTRGNIRRSKNEMHFAKLCKTQFSNVKENEPMFDGWDADVILPDLKIAVMWNGVWHYQKIHSTHSLLQVQSRDKIKAKKIAEFGYTLYIIKDMGKHNPKFVEEQFNIFIDWLKTKK